MFILPELSYSSCTICDGNDNNNGYCVGNNIKACVDEQHSSSNPKCRIGAISQSECPSIGG